MHRNVYFLTLFKTNILICIMLLKQGFGKYFDNPSIEKKERKKTQKEK
jgi:hypothetical protein